MKRSQISEISADECDAKMCAKPSTSAQADIDDQNIVQSMGASLKKKFKASSNMFKKNFIERFQKSPQTPELLMLTPTPPLTPPESDNEIDLVQESALDLSLALSLKSSKQSFTPPSSGKDNQWMMLEINEPFGPLPAVEMASYYTNGVLTLESKIKRLCDEDYDCLFSYIDLCFGMSPFSPQMDLPPLTKNTKKTMFQMRVKFVMGHSAKLIDFLREGQLLFQKPSPFWIPIRFLYYEPSNRNADVNSPRDVWKFGVPEADVMAMAATKKKAMKLFKRSKEREEKLEKLNVEEKRYIKENEVDKDIALMIFPTMIELQTHLYKELMEYCVWLLSQLNKDMNKEIYRELLLAFKDPEDTIIYMEEFLENKFMKMIFRNKIILRKREFTGLWARKEKLIVEAHEMELQNDTKRMKREAKDMERQVAIVEVAKKRRANRDIIRLSSL